MVWHDPHFALSDAVRTRQNKGWTIREVGEAIDMSPATVGDVERNRNNNPKTVQRYIDFVTNAPYKPRKKYSNSKGAKEAIVAPDALCWSCDLVGKRQCSWDDKLEVPKGAEVYVVKRLSLPNLTRIVSCPQFCCEQGAKREERAKAWWRKKGLCGID